MKNKKILILPALFLSVGALASCSSHADPNKALMEKAKGYYSTLRSQLGIPEDQDYKAWYFDPETLKGFAFENEKSATYLGILNIQNLTFSEVENTHFLDIPNYDVTINDDLSFEMPPELNFENPLDFLKTLPLVLVKDSATEISTSADAYSKINVEGDTVSLSTSATADNYNPNLFFIKNFGYDIKNGEDVLYSFDYRDCATSFMKRDVLGIIEEQLQPQEENPEVKQLQPEEFIDFSKILTKSYNKANNIDASTSQLAPANLVIPGTFGNEHLPVAVGPMSFKTLFETNSIKDVTSLTLDEGVKKVAFYAFDSTNISSLNFPSTLETVDFTSFSNMRNLKSLYIPNTKQPIKFFNTNSGSQDFEIDGPTGKINITVGESFANSTIERVTFENYDNNNVRNFNVHVFDVPEDTKESDVVKFIDKENNELYPSIKNGLFDKNLNSFNTAFMLDPEVKGPVIDFDTLPSNKTLYVAHEKGASNGDLFNSIADYHEPVYTEGVGNRDAATITLKLQNDLVVKGNLVVSGKTGKAKSALATENDKFDSLGAAIDSFAQLDLNGHKLIVDGGLLDVSGKIIDTSTGDAKGSIEVKNNGTFKANLVIHDNYNYSNYTNKFNNGEFPYHFYNFDDIEVPFTIANDSKLYARETSIKNEQEVVSNEIYFAGLAKETGYLPYIEFVQDGKLIVNSKTADSNEKSVLTLNGHTRINPLRIAYKNEINPQANEEMVNKLLYPLTSKILDVVVPNGSYTEINVNAKLLNDSELRVETGAEISINKSFITYEIGDNNSTQSNISSPNLGKEPAKFIVNGNLLEPRSRETIFFGGRIISDLRNVHEFVNSSIVKPGCISTEGGNNAKGNYEILHKYTSLINVVSADESPRYFRGNSGYYYDYNYDNNHGTAIVSRDLNTNLATKPFNGNWTIHTGSKDVLTDTNVDVFDQYVVKLPGGIIKESYILDNTGVWNEGDTNYDDKLKVYEQKGEKLIYYHDETFIQGKLIQYNGKYDPNKLIFKDYNGFAYFYSNIDDSWEAVQLFEHDNIICYSTNPIAPGKFDKANNYTKIDLFDTKDDSISRYTLDEFNYSETYHFIEDKKSAETLYKINTKAGLVNVDLALQDRYIFKDKVGTNYYIYAEDKMNSSNSYFATITDRNFDPENTTIVNLDGNFVYGYTSNNKWQRGILYDQTSENGFKFFQILDEGDISKNFALYQENGGESSRPIFKVFTKASGILVNASELGDGLTDLLPSDQTNYVGYRYIVIDGLKKVFAQFEKDLPEGEKAPVELITISEKTTFINKEDCISGPDDKIDLQEAFSLMAFKYQDRSLYIDFKKSISCGDIEYDLDKGTYLALAVYTDKNIIGQGIIPGM